MQARRDVEIRGVAQRGWTRVDHAGRRDLRDDRIREAVLHRPGGGEVVRRVEDVVLFDREVVRVAVVGERNRADAVAAAQDGLVVHAIREADTRPEVPEVLLDTNALRHAAVACDLQRVGRGIVVGQAALIDEADHRRVVLVPQSEVERQVRRHLPLVLDEREERPEADARIGHLQVALDERGNIEQERRERVREAGRGGRIRRDRRLRCPELELPARAAVVLRLQQEVARVPQVLAKLDGVVPLHFREHARELHRALAAIPREAPGEADHRVAETQIGAEVDLRHARRPFVDVRAADADIRRCGRHAVDRCLVVEVVHAAARFHHECVAEGARVVEAGTVRRVDACAREPVARRPPLLRAAKAGIVRRIGDVGTQKAEARRELIGLTELRVHLGVERMRQLGADVVLLEIDLARRRIDVRRGQVRQNRFRDRADAIGRDDVVRERRAPGTVGAAGRWIVDLRRGRREVAVPERRRRDDRSRRPAGMVRDVAVVAEEEQLVALNRAAEREAGLEVVGRRVRVREVAGRVRLLVVAEGERASLDIVRAGPQRHVRDRAAGAAELRVVHARRDVHRLDRFRRRNERRQQTGAVVVVDPFDLHVVGEPRLPVDVRREAVLRVEEFRVRPERPRRARYGDEHPLEVAVESERHFLQVDALDDAPRVGAVGLQQWTGADDGDRFFERADVHPAVDAHRGVDRHLDALAHEALEARELGRDAVGAVLQIREGVVPGLVRRRRVRDVGVDFRDRDRHARQHCA